MTRSKPPIDKEEEFERLAAQMFNFRSKSLILLFDFENKKIVDILFNLLPSNQGIVARLLEQGGVS